MDVSKTEESGGEALIDTLVSLTGVPTELMQAELSQILEISGHNSEDLTLDQLRMSLVTYLEQMHEALGFEGDPLSANPDQPTTMK